MEAVNNTGRFMQIDPVKKNATPEPTKVFELDKLAHQSEPQAMTRDNDVAKQQPGSTFAPHNSSDIAKIVNSQPSSVNQIYGRNAGQQNAAPGTIFTTRA